jgi:hypothetical protein
VERVRGPSTTVSSSSSHVARSSRGARRRGGTGAARAGPVRRARRRRAPPWPPRYKRRGDPARRLRERSGGTRNGARDDRARRGAERSRVTSSRRPRARRAATQRGRPRRAGDDRDGPSPRSASPLEVRLLGSLLGQVIAEQAGRELLDLVERVRRTTIRLRRGDDRRAAGRLAASSRRSTPTGRRSCRGVQPLLPPRQPRRGARAGPSAPRAERTPRAGADRAGAARRATSGRTPRSPTPSTGCVAAARTPIVPPPSAPADHAGAHRPSDGGAAADRPDRAPSRRRHARPAGGSRPDAGRGRDARRRLREEITILWRTADLRATRSRPLDEVRTALASSTRRCSARPPAVPARRCGARRASDGRGGPDRGAGEATTRAGPADRRAAGDAVPALGLVDRRRTATATRSVTAEVTERTLRIQADHVLRGYEASPTRCRRRSRRGRSGAVARRSPRASRATRSCCRTSIGRSAGASRRAVPPAVRVHRERLRRTRATSPAGGAADGPLRRAAELDAELAEIQEALVADGLDGSRGARSPTCAGSSRRSGSTSRRSRSASTAASTARPRRRSRRATRPRGRAGRDRGRGARDVPGVAAARPATATAAGGT